jgi:CBS domain-containing protein
MNARNLLRRGSIQVPLHASSVGEGLDRLRSGRGEAAAPEPEDGGAVAGPSSVPGQGEWPPAGALVKPVGKGGFLVVLSGGDEARLSVAVFTDPLPDPSGGTRSITHLLLLETGSPILPGPDVPRELIRALEDPEVESALLAARSPREVEAIGPLAHARMDRSLRVGDALVPMEYRVYPETPAAEVLDLMARKGLSAVPVVGEGMQVVGIFTAGDAVRVHLERRAEAPTLPTREVMTRAVLCVTEEQALEDAARIMVNRNLRQVPVVREGELVGFLTRESVLRALEGRGAKGGEPSR